MERASLAAGAGSCRWRWSLREAPIEAALGPIALAAARLFTEGDFGRIKECRGHACGWLFCDTSKNNRRRWCEMEVCGNRAKQKRLAARRRAA
jgi:predicted RNA-binding Zn ribbon-like protein